jgi:N-acetylmuramoyl-L-alanine amidase
MSALLSALALLYRKEPLRHPTLRAVTFAQWMLESGRGSSALAQQHYNFGGLKWRPEMAGLAKPVAYAAHDGADKYCKFATLSNFINGYWRFLQRAPYSGWEEHADDPEDFIRFIGKRYSTAAGYANKVLALVPEAEQRLASAGADLTGPGDTNAGSSLGTVVIDPGHGGTTKVGGSSPNNAISHSQVPEKKLTLDVALMIAAHLKAQAAALGKRIDVRLTREGDVNLGLAERAALAKQVGASHFLSLHFNGFNGVARGSETFYAAASNGNVNEAADKAFAQLIQTALLESLQRTGLAVKNRGVKADADTPHRRLGLLADAHLGNTPGHAPCVACLTELEFIDVPEVDRHLISGPQALRNRGAVAEGLAKALLKALQQG